MFNVSCSASYSSSSSSSRTYRLTWHKLNTIASRTRYTNYREKSNTDGKDLVNKNVLSCLLKNGKEVNAVMLVGRLFHARATVTRNDRSQDEIKISNLQKLLKLLLQITQKQLQCNRVQAETH